MKKAVNYFIILSIVLPLNNVHAGQSEDVSRIVTANNDVLIAAEGEVVATKRRDDSTPQIPADAPTKAPINISIDTGLVTALPGKLLYGIQQVDVSKETAALQDSASIAYKMALKAYYYLYKTDLVGARFSSDFINNIKNDAGYAGAQVGGYITLITMDCFLAYKQAVNSYLVWQSLGPGFRTGYAWGTKSSRTINLGPNDKIMQLGDEFRIRMGTVSVSADKLVVTATESSKWRMPWGAFTGLVSMLYSPLRKPVEAAALTGRYTPIKRLLSRPGVNALYWGGITYLAYKGQIAILMSESTYKNELADVDDRLKQLDLEIAEHADRSSMGTR